MKRLYKSKSNKVFSGVIGGVGEYFEIDPVLLRLFWLVIVIATGIIPGVLVYLVSIFIVPLHNEK
ncbi:MAG: PspC domain-containing protein [bacterium]|nr:PspC domain-containing protein [bacterium]